jgi:hypothetical protein
MRSKSLLISMMTLAFVCCTWFFTYTEAQYLSTPDLENKEISDPLTNIISLLQRITPLVHRSSQLSHASAEDAFIIIPHETIVRYLDESVDMRQFYDKVRIGVIQTLIDHQYPSFVTQPYQENGTIIVQSWDFKVLKNVSQQDSLDQLLMPKLSWFMDDFVQIKKLKQHLQFNTITITSDEYAVLGDIFLFKTEADLRALWYELVSRKSRINTDVDYRRHNIQSAFNNIGNIRLLMPGETFSTLRALRYVPGVSQYFYVDGLVTVGNGATMMYGGGLCGVATALFQWSLTNRGLIRLQYKPHSTYYRNLYEADINGITIKEPGLDATIFSPTFDLQLQNIRPYPIIIWFAYDGEVGSEEQVFTLAKDQDKGDFHFVRSFMKGTHSCFTREINEQTMTNCYRKVKNY